jgi:GT2 family glycosyltransferase
MKIPKIAFICVNFNNFIYSKKLCDSLILQRGKDSQFSIDCLIVDNSTDEQDSLALSEFACERPWINYLRAPKNLGYFGGLNYGLENAPIDIYSYVVIGNNDLTYEESFCQELCRANYGRNIYAVCPDVITKDGVHQNPHVAKRMGLWWRLQLDIYFLHYYFAWILLAILRVARPTKSSPPQPPTQCEIHMGIGACYVLTRAFFAKFRRLDYPHFLYGEEAYFSDQIHSSFGVLLFDPVLRVHHAESATLSKMPRRMAYEFARAGYPSYRKML